MGITDLHDFTVKVGVGTYLGPEPHDTFEVELPHQCDEWQITSAKTGAEAVEQLRHFIGRAQQALAELEQVEVCDHEWVATGRESRPHNFGTEHRLECARCDAVVWAVVDAERASPSTPFPLAERRERESQVAKRAVAALRMQA